MARLRNDGQRALAALILLPLFFTSCATYLPGWKSDADPSRTLGELEIGLDTQSITVSVRLPDNYLAAEGFVQRVVLETDAGVVTATRNDLADAFVLDLADPEAAGIVGAGAGVLRVTLGFCNVNTKDVCHIDIASLELRAAGTGEPHVGLLYSPPLPG